LPEKLDSSAFYLTKTVSIDNLATDNVGDVEFYPSAGATSRWLARAASDSSAAMEWDESEMPPPTQMHMSPNDMGDLRKGYTKGHKVVQLAMESDSEMSMLQESTCDDVWSDPSMHHHNRCTSESETDHPGARIRELEDMHVVDLDIWPPQKLVLATGDVLAGWLGHAARESDTDTDSNELEPRNTGRTGGRQTLERQRPTTVAAGVNEPVYELSAPSLNHPEHPNANVASSLSAPETIYERCSSANIGAFSRGGVALYDVVSNTTSHPEAAYDVAAQLGADLPSQMYEVASALFAGSETEDFYDEPTVPLSLDDPDDFYDVSTLPLNADDPDDFYDVSTVPQGVVSHGTPAAVAGASSAGAHQELYPLASAKLLCVGAASDVDIYEEIVDDSASEKVAGDAFQQQLHTAIVPNVRQESLACRELPAPPRPPKPIGLHPAAPGQIYPLAQAEPPPPRRPPKPTACVYSSKRGSCQFLAERPSIYCVYHTCPGEDCSGSKNSKQRLCVSCATLLVIRQQLGSAEFTKVAGKVRR